MREKIDTRMILEDLNEKFPGKAMLKIIDVMRYTGLSRNTVKSRFKFDDNMITKIALARQMSQ